MGKYTTSGFFPDGGPAKYSYTEDFGDRFGKTGRLAYLNVSLQGAFGAGIQSKNGIKALNNLKAQYERAREAENRFIAEHNLLITEGNSKRASNGSWHDIITAINEFYSTKEVFERNIQIIKQRSENGGGYSNALRFLPTYIKQAAEEIFKNRKWVNWRPDTLMNKILTLGLEKMIEMTDSQLEDGTIKIGRRGKKPKGEALQAYKSMQYLVDILGNPKSPFSQLLRKDIGLAQYVADLQETFSQGTSETIDVPTMKISTTGTGTIAEMASAASIEYFMGSLYSVLGLGHKGFKVDVASHNLGAEGDLFFKEMKSANSDESKRFRAIQEYQKAYDKLAAQLTDAKGEIIQISNKNYMINSNFSKKYHGFTAQGDTTLENFQAFMAELPNKTIDIDELIDYLANVGEYENGENMIIPNADTSILSGIATQMAYFLFDDIDIVLPENLSNINRVYLMDLSGVYVPLSIILEGIYNSLSQTVDSVTSEARASTSIDITGDGEHAQLPWDSEDVFISFRNARLEKTKISFHFLSNFTEFITKAMNINNVI